MIKTYLALFCLLFNLVFVVNGLGVNYGYHERVGIPRATELMRIEGLGRIIGGSKAAIIPYQAGLVTKLTTGWSSICGGSLVSNTRVLSAAHCYWDGQSQAASFTVVLGSTTVMTGGTRIETKDVVVHPNWKPSGVGAVTSDLLILRIRSVAYSNTIQAIPLPTTAQANNNFAGVRGTVSGYGKITDGATAQPSTILHQVTVTVMTNAACATDLKLTLQSSHLCTSGVGKVGTCDGDSGGPLTALVNNKNTLIGVVSFGLDEGCAMSKPSVYTRVTGFLPWINTNLK